MKYEEIINEFKKGFCSKDGSDWKTDKYNEVTISSNDVITFIESALTKNNEAIREMIEGMKKDEGVTNHSAIGHLPCCVTCGLQESCTCMAYNQALDDLLSNLSQETGK